MCLLCCVVWLTASHVVSVFCVYRVLCAVLLCVCRVSVCYLCVIITPSYNQRLVVCFTSFRVRLSWTCTCPRWSKVVLCCVCVCCVCCVCTFPPSNDIGVQVRYGHSSWGTWTYRTLFNTTNITCQNAMFGDPFPTYQKSCEFRLVTCVEATTEDDKNSKPLESRITSSSQLLRYSKAFEPSP